jgi:hypothetical protein
MLIGSAGALARVTQQSRRQGRPARAQLSSDVALSLDLATDFWLIGGPCLERGAFGITRGAIDETGYGSGFRFFRFR